MRAQGARNTNSKTILAFNVVTGLKLKIRGIRAFCTLIWGKTKAGVPKKLSSVIDMCNGESKQKDIDGWVFSYIKPKKDVIGEYLSKNASSNTKPAPSKRKSK